MKIGIVTIWDNTNLGNRLQNYALYSILSQKFGCDVVTLHTDPSKKPTVLQRIKELIAVKSCIIPEFAERRFGINFVRYSRFKDWNKRIPEITYYETACIPTNIDDEFDFFVSGSDQIWNYTLGEERLYNNFLQFASPNKRIAVSASIGLDHIGEEWQDYYANCLKEYRAISVREERAKYVIKVVSGRSSEVISDPVMVLDAEEWRKVSKKPRIDLNKEYILVYMLGSVGEETKKKINNWKTKRNCEVYDVLDRSVLSLYSSGPAEFLSLIDKAKLVVTDSFHCAAFSIIFSTPFVVTNRSDQLLNMGSRLDTLLNKYHLEDRREERVGDPFICDFDNSKEIIKAEKEKFLNYIRVSMSI